MSKILLSVLVAVASYLLGCISTGLIVSGKQGVDIRNSGSKNTGASNVLRVLGLKSGLVTFVGDFLKATIACLLGYFLLPGETFGIAQFGPMLGGLFAVIGHNWPVFYGFKGGKGIASSTAVILFVNPLWGAVSILLCLAVIVLTRFVSLGSMTMLFSFFVLICVTHWGQWALCLFAAALFAMCMYRHRANVGRLLKGTENKLGNRAKPTEMQAEAPAENEDKQ